MIAVNLVTAGAVYSDAQTREQPETVSINLYVYNAPVYWQWMDENHVWVEPEIYAPPGERSFDRLCRGARFRSVLPTKPALVTLELLARWDHPGGSV